MTLYRHERFPGEILEECDVKQIIWESAQDNMPRYIFEEIWRSLIEPEGFEEVKRDEV